MAMLSSPMKCYCTVSEVKPGSTNVNICVETSWKLFNQHGDAIINTIKSSRGQSSYYHQQYIFSSDNGDTLITN